jgi:hypothetical protein
MPLDPPALAVRREVTELMRAVHSYVKLVVHHWTVDDTKPIGTAVLLRAGARLFAVTAKHCVHADMSLYFRPADGKNRQSQILHTLTREPLDIAVLELEPRPDVSACDVAQLCLDTPSPARLDGDPAQVPLLWVAGFPARLASFRGDLLTAPQVAFGTNLVRSSRDELELYYHDWSYAVHPESLSCAASRLPETPHGFSGAGVWGLLKAEGLFNPLRHVRLYGIQHSWHPTTRTLKCVPSGVIAEMLLGRYPDLEGSFAGVLPASP